MPDFDTLHRGRNKRNADTDSFFQPPKRVRLESMLEKLSLRSDPETTGHRPSYRINPLVESTEPQPKKRRTADLDALISEKMAEAYKDHILQGLVLLRYEHPFAILVKHFQSWVKRLFNVFVREYNERTGGSRNMKPFKSFSRIIALTRDVNVAFTYADLLNIVFEESVLEAQRLKLKRDKKLDSDRLREIKDEEELARENSYTYWDRVSALSGDVDMDEYGENYSAESLGRASFVSSPDAEMIVDLDGTGCSVEANYGNYYGTSYSNFYA